MMPANEPRPTKESPEELIAEGHQQHFKSERFIHCLGKWFVDDTEQGQVGQITASKLL
jgi:hypothetical protein